MQSTFEDAEDLRRHLHARDKARMNLIPKTQAYWQGDDNVWNRKEFTCRKVFKQYHKYNEEKSDLVNNLEKMQDQWEKVEKHQDKYLWCKAKRADMRAVMESRKLERTALQTESGQVIFDSSADGQRRCQTIDNSDVQTNRKRLINRSGCRGLLLKDTPNLWNDFSSKSGKIMNLYLRPEMLMNEERSFELMRKKISDDLRRSDMQKMYREIEHDVLRHDTTRLRMKGEIKNISKTVIGQTSVNISSKSPISKRKARIANAYSFFYKFKVSICKFRQKETSLHSLKL